MQKRLRSEPEQGEDADEDLAEAAPAAGLSEKYSGVKVKASH